MKPKKNTGFTLVEFLLVIIMFGLLLAVILPRAQHASAEAKFSQTLQHGSEIAGYIVTWAENNINSLSSSSPYTLRELLLSELDPDVIGFKNYPLVNRYTGNEHYNGIEALYPFEHLPTNPFNDISYFDKANNDRDNIPSSRPGLLYLATIVTERLNQPYRYFYLLVTGMDGNWHGSMSLNEEGIRRGIFVTQMPEIERMPEKK